MRHGRDARGELVFQGDQVLVGSIGPGPGFGNQRRGTVLDITTRNGAIVQLETGETTTYDCASIWKIVTGTEEFNASREGIVLPPAGASDVQPDAGADSHVANLGNKKG